MYSLGGIKVNNVVCINLPFRTDRKEAILEQAKSKGFPVSFYTAKYNETDPEKGRFQSHLNVIKHAKRSGHRSILILEDDAKIWTPRLSVSAPPDGWKMLYLGGNVQSVLDDANTNTSDLWKRVCCLTSHAYVLKYYMYNIILQKAPAYIGKMTLDEFYCKIIHPEFAAYMITPEHIIQSGGYSDIKKRDVAYNQILTKRMAGVNNPQNGTETEESITEFDKVETEIVMAPPSSEEPIDENVVPQEPNAESMTVALKSTNLTDAELPFVTLITPTSNRPGMADFLVWSFYKQLYPEDKIQWIIADDGDLDKKIRNYLPPDDPRIKYINCKTGKGQFLSMPQKLNLCNTYITDRVGSDGVKQPQVILHFFDFVYHHPLSTLSRVKALLQNKTKECIGCTEFGVFDFENNKSYVNYYPDANDNKTILCLQSLGYYKSFWEERKFDETKLTLPSYFYIFNRMSKAISMPYEFAMITLYSTALIDNLELREKNRKADAKISQKSSFSFFKNWDRDTQEFILLLKETVK